MAIVDETRSKVQAILTAAGNVTIDRDGDYSIRNGSVRMFVRVSELNKDHSLINIFTPLLSEVPVSQEVYRYVAEEGKYKFGSLVIVPSEGGKVTIIYDHTLLGTYLDPQELEMALFLMATTADGLDDALQQKFGGHRFHEE